MSYPFINCSLGITTYLNYSVSFYFICGNKGCKRIYTFNIFFILVNPDNKIGAVGFTTMIAPALYPITLIKIDERTGEHIRDRNGVCVRAKPGETSKLTLSIKCVNIPDLY